MFTEFTTQTWTPSSGAVVITDDTDEEIDGSSKKIVWTDGENETCTMGFDAVTLSDYEEISLHIYEVKDLDHASGNVFSITIDGNTFNFEKIKRGWNHILFDCSGMGSTTEIIITSLVENLTLYIDYIGYRKVTYDMDIDIIDALKDHISLNYNVSTTLSADASSGTTTISLANKRYIYDSSIIELDNGAGTTEEVQLTSKTGILKTALTNSFSSGDTVNVLCPVRSENYDDMEPDPICGVVVYDKIIDKEDTVVKIKDGYKQKKLLGFSGVMVYIDCASKKKVLQLANEYNVNYGERFQIFLDGELVDVILETSQFVDDTIGNNPRMSYYYEIQPQPYNTSTTIPVDSLTVTLESSDI